MESEYRALMRANPGILSTDCTPELRELLFSLSEQGFCDREVRSGSTMFRVNARGLAYLQQHEQEAEQKIEHRKAHTVDEQKRRKWEMSLTIVGALLSALFAFFFSELFGGSLRRLIAVLFG